MNLIKLFLRKITFYFFKRNKGFYSRRYFYSYIKKPFLTIRKYKKIHNKFAGKKVIVIDDLLHTGNSLKASVKLLSKVDIEVVGAFYLADYAEDEVRSQFNFLSIPY